METQNNSTETGDRQPSDVPNPGEKDNSVETSDHVPLPSSQQNAAARHPLATDPFEDILKVLADLERDDPNFAFPAARLVGLYGRLWESCVSKHIDGQKLEQETLLLDEAGAHLRTKRDGLQLRHDKQLARLRFFERALASSRERLTCILDDWNYPFRLSLAGLLDNAGGK
ncbi:unnamed protein product [Penicillium olsonii]|nr:unnamed protein product [Penicillium olsonii]